RVYIRRVDADGRRLSTLQAAGAGVSPPQQSRQLATEIRRALLVRRDGILCLRAGWREEAGTDDPVQSPPLVGGRNPESGACGQSHRAPAWTRYVERLGDSNSLRKVSRLQSVLLSERLHLATRQRHYRHGLQALWILGGSGQDRTRHQRSG